MHAMYDFLTLVSFFILYRYGHMIDNVVLIVTGTLHERDVQDLLEKCHPLGMFDRYFLTPKFFFAYFSFGEISSLSVTSGK